MGRKVVLVLVDTAGTRREIAGFRGSFERVVGAIKARISPDVRVFDPSRIFTNASCVP